MAVKREDLGAEEPQSGPGAAKAKKKERLRSELARLEARLKWRNFLTRTFVCFGFLFLVWIPFLYRYQLGPDLWSLILASAVYSVGFFLAAVLWRPGLLDTSIKETESELELLEAEDDSDEYRAEKLFKLHQLELEKYYRQTLRHGAWIFWAGIFCIGIGLGVVVASIAFVRQPELDLNGKIVAAVLGVVSGILANFIAVIYLKMHSETIKSLNEFHNRLVTTHHLHFGNLLAAKVDNLELREETLSQMAINLAAIKPADEPD